MKRKMALTTPPPRTVAGVETTTMGQETALQQLQAALQDVQSQGCCQVVTISGAPGIGKTRLLSEFERWATAQSPVPLILLGQATPEWRSQPYALLRDLLSRHCQIRGDDPVAEVMEKLARALREAFAADKGITERVLLVGYLVGFSFGTRLTLQPTVDELRNRVPPEEFEAGLARGRTQRLEEVAGRVLAEE